MSELACHPAQAAHELSVDEDSRADALRNGDYDQIAAFVHAIEPDRRQDARIGGVFEAHLEVRSPWRSVHGYPYPPLQIGSEDQPVGRD